MTIVRERERRERIKGGVRGKDDPVGVVGGVMKERE
jgi:hypothetical protein